MFATTAEDGSVHVHLSHSPSPSLSYLSFYFYCCLLQMSGMQVEHMDALNRKNIIEKRKEEAERREQDKTREEAR